MRRLFTAGLLLSALAGAAVVGASIAPASEARTANLKVVGTWPNLNNWKNFERPFWSERIEEASDGAITAQISPVTELGMKGFEVMRMLRLGVFDVAHGVFSYVASEEPAVEGIDLSGLAAEEDQRRALVAAYRPILEEIFATRYDAKLLTIYPDPKQMFWCNGDIRSVEDLKDRRIRIFSRAHGDMVEGLGATSVTIPFGELPLALQKKTVDCAITGTVGAYLANLGDVTTNAFTLDLGQTSYFVAVSNKTWDRLSPQQQATLAAEVERLGDEIWARNEIEAQEALECITGSADCQLGEPGDLVMVSISSSDREARLSSVKTSVVPRWSERCGPDCSAEWNATVGKVIGVEATAASQ